MANNFNLLINIILLMICIYQSIATLFTDLLFQHNTIEDFNGVNMNIGWVQFASCKEGCSGTCDNNDHSLIYPNEWTKQELIDLSKYAITVKILPSSDVPGAENTEYAVTADVCSNPIYALNNGYELTHTLDLATSLISGFTDLNYWIGSSNAKNRMTNSCYNYGRSLGGAPLLISDNEFYFACGNSGGLHIHIGNSKGTTCRYNYANNVGHDITIWIGFDSTKTKMCELISPLNYALSTVTDQPTDLPTNQPSSASAAPSNTPTTLPTDAPSKVPSTAIPSSIPTITPITSTPTGTPSNAPSTSSTRIHIVALITAAPSSMPSQIHVDSTAMVSTLPSQDKSH
eukprot:170694_1